MLQHINLFFTKGVKKMEKNQQGTIITGDFFMVDGKLIKDNGLTIDTKKVLEALAGLKSGENWSVRTLVDEKGFSRKRAITAVLELSSAEIVKYDAKKDLIELL